MKRSLAIVIVFTMAFSLFPAGVLAAETKNATAADVTSMEATPPEPAMPTSVEGLITETTKPASSDFKDTITVFPARGRTVSLQMYDEEEEEWITQKEFEAPAEEKGKVVLEYPKNWKKTNVSIWRVRIAAGENAEAYTSPKIKIMTRNRHTLKLTCKSAIIMEKDSGQIFYGKSMDTKRAHASTTKIMTAILALEKKKWDSKAKISKKAVKTPYTSLRYKTNDRVRMGSLLHAALILSDNGSATALAEHVSGSTKAFAAEMNAKAKALGCQNTHFVNPHGLDSKGHYSTARDIAVMSQHALKKKKFRNIVKKKKYTFKTLKKHKTYTVKTTNKLLGKVEDLSGIKTGTTGNAGCCFVGAYNYDGETYITVVLGSKNDKSRWSDTKTLIRYIEKYI